MSKVKEAILLELGNFYLETKQNPIEILQRDAQIMINAICQVD